MRTSILVLHSIFLVLAGCFPGEDDLRVDLDPPAVLEVTHGELRSPGSGLGALDEIQIRFSEPLDPVSVSPETVVVVPAVETGTCAATGSCVRGRCLQGSCQESAVTPSFASDVNAPPLAESRRAQVLPVDIELETGGTRVVVRPRAPWVSGRLHTLVLSAAVRDLTGNPLVAADGRWKGMSWDFTVGVAAPVGPTFVAPAPDTVGVPVNLPEVLVGSAGPIQGWETDLWLSQAGGRVPGTTERADGRCGAGVATCLRIQLGSSLAPSSRYMLSWGTALTDAAGAPVVQPAAAPTFETGATPDREPPVVTVLTAEAEGGCLDVALSTDEPSRGQVRWVVAGVAWSTVELTALSTEHHLAIAPDPELVGGLEVRLVDVVGNERTEVSTPEIPGPLPAAVALTEVLANPAGPEPAQEWVELVVLAADPVSTAGWRVTDALDRPGDELPAETLLPGAVALIVPSGFDAAEGSDVAPGSAAVLLRLAGSTIGSAGLANGGEPVFLLDAAGRLVSHYPGPLAGGDGPASGQSVGRRLGAGCGERGAWTLQPEGQATPGWIDPS